MGPVALCGLWAEAPIARPAPIALLLPSPALNPTQHPVHAQLRAPSQDPTAQTTTVTRRNLSFGSLTVPQYTAAAYGIVRCIPVRIKC